MKNLLLILFTSFFFSCGKKVESVSPFKEGDIVYRKIDSTKVLILLDLGKFDKNVYLFRVSYKEDGKEMTKFAYSTELFKK